MLHGRVARRRFPSDTKHKKIARTAIAADDDFLTKQLCYAGTLRADEQIWKCWPTQWRRKFARAASRVGARMPSLRQIIAQHGVSQSTVFRAYYLLEEWGLVRAQETLRLLCGARRECHSRTNASAGGPGRIKQGRHQQPGIFRAGRCKDAGIVPLGSAFPSPLLFPLPRLAKSLAQASRLISPLEHRGRSATGQ